jgi:hypothetical protein
MSVRWHLERTNYPDECAFELVMKAADGRGARALVQSRKDALRAIPNLRRFIAQMPERAHG